MKKKHLILEKIILLPDSLIGPTMHDMEIMNIAKNMEPTYHTPGTAQMVYEMKNTDAGQFYEVQFRYSIPSIPTPEEMEYLKGIGAAILTAENGRTFIFHKNDFAQNTPLRFDIEGSTEKTIIKTSILTINPI